MKPESFVFVVAGLLVCLVIAFVALIMAGNRQSERTQQAFVEACSSVGGKAVWNNKYWECLK